ncbi:MAG: LOG family protein [Ignavibacteria bacterium]|nr:LOG family protein [Ignavibacteria bacterium]
MKQKVITIFGSSFPKSNDDEYLFAYELGKKLGENKFTICNGGFYGTMEASAKGASEVGAHTIGVTIENYRLEKNKFIKEEIKCPNLFERVMKLIELADGYVVLKGGTGTLLELSAVWELINKNMLDKKPIVAYKNFWKTIIDKIDEQMIYEGRESGLILLSDNIDEICDYLKIKLLSNS